VANFPLPNLRHRLEDIRDDVYDGRGFAILRGLDVDSYSPVDLGIVSFGITSYVAEIRGKQDRNGEIISKESISLSWVAQCMLRAY